MAPQSFERIESAPGNGSSREAPDPQDIVCQRDGAFARAHDPAGQAAHPVEAPPIRPQMAVQSLEKIEFQPRNGCTLEAPDPQDVVGWRGGAFAAPLDPAGHTPHPAEAPPTSPEMPPQGLEKIASAPGNGMAPQGSNSGPTAANRSGVRPIKLAMRRNGVGLEPDCASS
jgi:hypothetical protein